MVASRGQSPRGPRGGSRSRSDFPSPSQCHVCRLRLTLPHQNLRDKMRPLEVVRSRRGARVDESTCLESMRLGNGTVGSNPTLSAIQCLFDPEPLEIQARGEVPCVYRGRALCNRTL